MAKVKMHGIVAGYVQGVGFRYFVRSEADRLGLAGWVGNLSNGNVEFEAEGEEKLVDEFIEVLRNNHSPASVDEIRLNRLAVSEVETGFKIKF